MLIMRLEMKLAKVVALIQTRDVALSDSELSAAHHLSDVHSLNLSAVFAFGEFFM